MFHLYFLSRLAFFFRLSPKYMPKGQVLLETFLPFSCFCLYLKYTVAALCFITVKMRIQNGTSHQEMYHPTTEEYSTQMAGEHQHRAHVQLALLCISLNSACCTCLLLSQGRSLDSGLEAVLCYVKFMRLQSFDLCECAVWLWIALLESSFGSSAHYFSPYFH